MTQGKVTKDVVLPCAYEEGGVSIQTLIYTMNFRALTEEERFIPFSAVTKQGLEELYSCLQ